MSKTTLIIVRHGNTFGPGDVVTRQGGRTDLPLVESGLEQGRQVGAYLKQEGLQPDVVYTSHLQRTIQTAEQALRVMGLSVTPQPIDVFNEIDYGQDENRPEDEVVNRLGQVTVDNLIKAGDKPSDWEPSADEIYALGKATIKLWDTDCIVPDGWKADAEAMKNDWVSFADTVLDEHQGKTIMVVSSNGVLRFAPTILNDADHFNSSQNLKFSTGAVSVLTHDPENGWVCETWNIKPKDALQKPYIAPQAGKAPSP
jgi:2,3-bisphosphoglycerate-dependent phosphoglycerate mutase